MISVGIREMKNRLSEYIRRVREGETILVTDRGQVVAKITQPSVPAFEEDGIGRLVADGLITRRGGKNAALLYPELPAATPRITALDLLDELRGES